MSWSEFAAGTTQAQLGHFEVESGKLNLAETRVRSVPGEGLESSRGKPSQDVKSCAFFIGPDRMKMASVSTRVFDVRAREAAPYLISRSPS